MSLFKCCDILVGHLDLTLLVIVFVIILSVGVHDVLLVLLLPNIAFVCQNNDIDVCATVFLNLLKPSVNIYERFFVS